MKIISRGTLSEENREKLESRGFDTDGAEWILLEEENGEVYDLAVLPDGSTFSWWSPSLQHRYLSKEGLQTCPVAVKP